MKMQRRKSKGLARVSAWVLSLAMMLSLVSVPMKAKAEESGVVTYDLLNGSIQSSIGTATLDSNANDYLIDDVKFETMPDGLGAPSSYGSLTLKAKVRIDTVSSGTVSMIAYAMNSSWKWADSGTYDVTSVAGDEVEISLNLKHENLTDVAQIGIRAAKCTEGATIGFTVLSAEIVAVSAEANIEDVGATEGASVAYNCLSGADGGYQEYAFTVTNNTGKTMNDWMIVVTLSSAASEVQDHPDYSHVRATGSGTTVYLYPNTAVISKTIANGVSVTLEKLQYVGGAVSGATVYYSETDGAFDSIIEDVTGGSGNSGGSTGSTITISSDTSFNNFAKLLQYSLYFYDANMCGSQVGENSLFDWRDDCHTYDSAVTYTSPAGKNYTVDVSGGFHDAGDVTKFGMPQGYAAATLGMGYYEFKDAFTATGQTEHYKTIADYFCDYFRRCTVWEGDAVIAFCYQVGDGNSDHSQWCAPETQTKDSLPRPAYFADSNNPGTDEVGAAVAALALNYANFKNANDLKYAKALFKFADEMSTKAVATEGTTNFYGSNTYKDDMAWAAAALYVATGEETYRTKYNSYISGADTGSVHCWAQTAVGAGLLMGDYANTTQILNSTMSKTTSEGYSYWDDGGWGTARYNTALQLMGLIYDKKTGTNTYGEWAKGQMQYLLGNNEAGNCYVVGYNAYSVKYPHHRAASGITNWNDFTNWTYGGYYAHTLTGALVGGPDKNSTYSDVFNGDKGAVYNEVAVDYNAAFVGAAAALYLQNASDNNQMVDSDYTYDASITCSKNSGGLANEEPDESVVVVPVTGVTLDTSSKTLKVGETATLVATVAPDNATNKKVTWASSDSQVATVNNGVVTAIASGTANITATTEDGSFTATCAVTVKAPGYVVANPQSIDFGNKVYGYGAIAHQGVSLTNTGDMDVSIQNVAMENGFGFTISGSTATLNKNAFSTISVTPKTGLDAGVYTDNVIIQTSENTVTIPVTMTVTKAQSIAVAAPTLQTRNANIISVNFADAGVTQQYAIVVKGQQVKESDWKDCTGDVMTITGLTPCTNYEVYARAKADNNHYVGASSEALNVLTLVENPYAIDVSQITSRDCDYVKAFVAVENGEETPTVSVTEENGKLVVTLTTSGQPYTIIGSNTNINVNTGNATNVVLSNTTINQLVVPSISADTVTISVVGTNTIASGIQVVTNGTTIAPVKITSEKTADSTYAGSLKVTNESGAAISSEGSVEIAGGYVDLIASGAAIEAGSIIVTGGSIKAETTGDGSVFDATDKISLTGGAITTVKPENNTADDFSVSDPEGTIITDGVAITGEPTFSKEPVDQNGQTVVMVLVTFTDDTGASLTNVQVKKGADLNLADVKILAADGVTDYAISKPGYVLSWKHTQTTYATTEIVANITDAITLQAVWTFITYPIEQAVISDIANQTYTGAALTPKVTVTYDSKTLLQDTHYTVTYSDNVNAGTATVTISGLGAYVGAVQKTFAILPKSISSMNASLSADTFAYTGLEIKPEVTLTDGNTTLVRDVHYTVIYTNNINAGTATAVIVGKGNYTGQITLAFTIYEVVTTVDIADVEISEIADQIYTGKPITPSLVLSYNGTVLTQGVDYDVQYTNNVNVGEATVTIIGKGDFVGSTEETFDIIIKKNKKYTKGNYQYQITSAKTNGKGTVQLVKCVKKSKTANIAATVNIGGVNFKITSIKANAFKNNKTMTKLVIGKNVTTIGDKAFYGCTKLKNATIGSGVKKIGKQAFYNCKAMKNLVISTSKLKTSAIGSKAFTKMGASNYKKLVVKVPKKQLSAYKKMLKKKGLSSKAKIKK